MGILALLDFLTRKEEHIVSRLLMDRFSQFINDHELIDLPLIGEGTPDPIIKRIWLCKRLGQFFVSKESEKLN